jgi:hypothetical protein
MTTYADAKRLADQLLAELSPVCERIEIAGGVRREKSDPHDIELVAIPKTEPMKDMFGAVAGQRNLLNQFIEDNYFCDKNGDRYKKIVLPEDINCDLFIVLPPMCLKCGTMFNISAGGTDGPQEVRENLSEVRKGVSGPGTHNVLLQELRGNSVLRSEGTQNEQKLPGNMPQLREGISEKIFQQNGAVLFDKMCEGGLGEKSYTEAPKMEGVSTKFGLDDFGQTDSGRIYPGLPSGTPSFQFEGFNDGTPISNGKENGALSGNMGEGSSQERNKIRQPNRKLGTCYAREAQRVGDLPPLPTRIPSALTLVCPSCGNKETKQFQVQQFGVIMVIRTGPADFSKRIVTPRYHRGCLPSDCRVEDGAVWHGDQIIPMPEEIDFLEFLGLGWVEPKERK